MKPDIKGLFTAIHGTKATVKHQLKRVVQGYSRDL